MVLELDDVSINETNITLDKINSILGTYLHKECFCLTSNSNVNEWKLKKGTPDKISLDKCKLAAE